MPRKKTTRWQADLVDMVIDLRQDGHYLTLGSGFEEHGPHRLRDAKKLGKSMYPHLQIEWRTA